MKKNILVVDDNTLARKIIYQGLNKDEYEIQEFDSPLKSYDVLKNKKIDLVITDYNMPYVDGFQYLLWIKNNSPKTKVIMMSGYADDALMDAVNKESKIKFFAKPVNLKELNCSIQELFEEKKFKGKVSNIGVLELLQLIIISGKKKVLLIESEQGKKGLLFIDSGNVIHAEFAQHYIGVDAFHKIISMGSGIFSELDWYEPPITINVPYNDLIQDNISEPLKGLTNNINVLVVDDSDVTRAVVQQYVKVMGFNVFTAESAIQAYEMFKEADFDFVITDIMMPEVNGIDLLLWVNENRPGTKVILMTGYDVPELETIARNNGGFNFFKKPFNRYDLEQTLLKAMNKNGLRGEVSYIELSDYIQLSLLSGQNKLIQVSDMFSEKKGLIYVEDGVVTHAEFSGKKGPDAFFFMYSMKDGLFFDINWDEPKIKTTSISYAEIAKTAPKNQTFPNPSSDIEYSSTSLVRSQETPVSRIRKNFTIFETGSALGIYLGKSTKQEVLEIISKYSSKGNNANYSDHVLFDNDLNCSFTFNNEDIIEEIRFDEGYQGKTSLGIGIGDNIEKAIKVYGPPRVCTVKGAVWDNIGIFFRQDKSISSIRIRKQSFFENTKTEEKINKYIINENELSLFNIVVKEDTKVDVINKMKQNTDSGISEISESVINYADFGVAFHFSKNSKLRRIHFNKNFNGETLKGLKVNDDILKAVELYGKPKLHTSVILNWDNISVLIGADNFITEIRISTY